MYFKKFEPGFAKLEQTLIARFVLNRYFSKQEQLTILFNYAYLGHVNGKGVRGFEAAAQVYFKRPFDELNFDQYLALVAMLISPNNLSVSQFPKQNALRVARIKEVLAGTYVPTSLTDVYY